MLKQEQVPLAYDDSDSSEDDARRPRRRRSRPREPLPHSSLYLPTPLTYSEQFTVEVFINTPDPSGVEAHAMSNKVVESFDTHDASTQEPVVNVYGENAMVHFQFADFQTPDIETLVHSIAFEGPAFAEKREFSRSYGTYTLHYTTYREYDSLIHVVAISRRPIVEYEPKETTTRSGRLSRPNRSSQQYVDYGPQYSFRTTDGMSREKKNYIRRKYVEDRQRRMRQERRAEQSRKTKPEVRYG